MIVISLHLIRYLYTYIPNTKGIEAVGKSLQNLSHL